MSGSNQGHVAPEVTYYQAMELFCVTPDGAICTVEQCPPGAFGVLVQVAAQTAKNPSVALAALNGLDYRFPIDRWYGLLALVEYGAQLPTFATEALAHQAREAGTNPTYPTPSTRVEGATK